jgi:molybdopterin synthase sulfur carrier subunit
VIRVVLPAHLRTLARIDGEVELDVAGQVTQCSVLDALETRYPMLRGTIRDHDGGPRRAFIRFFACEQDLSHEQPDTPLRRNSRLTLARLMPNISVTNTAPMVDRWITTVVSVLVSIHPRPAPCTDGHPDRVRTGHERSRTPVNGGQHCWKACWQAEPRYVRQTTADAPPRAESGSAACLAQAAGDSGPAETIMPLLGQLDSGATGGGWR